jgi:hypothetical protein
MFAQVQFVPPLKFLASVAVVEILEEGFLGIHNTGPGPTRSTAEVRGRLFNYDARCASRISPGASID